MLSIPPIRPGRWWWLAQRDFKRGRAATWHDYITSKRILSECVALPKTDPNSPTPTVHVLTGQDQWLLTAWMLASWFHFTERSWNVQLHDDGSLKANAIAQIEELFPGITIIRREHADELINPLLERYPKCQAYRNQHPLGLKCFDIPHISKGDRFILLDSDVLFFKKPTFILDWASNADDGSTWYNQDPQEPSPISPARCVKDFGFTLWPRVNSGLGLIHQSTIDLDAFEKWIGHESVQSGKAWRTEQTLLALGASSVNNGGALPEHYEVSLSQLSQTDCTARHYVGAVRQRFYGEGIQRLRHLLLKA